MTDYKLFFMTIAKINKQNDKKEVPQVQKSHHSFYAMVLHSWRVNCSFNALIWKKKIPRKCFRRCCL